MMIYTKTPHMHKRCSVKSQHLAKVHQSKVHCASGGRSAVACQLLKQQGFTDVENLGGYDDACKCVENAL